ncbi:D-alanyl-D-alanine carboxypeptidase-like protein [Herbinix hemicellulosilytica]|uniref:Peptidase M15C domain-containing protein n=1 Tax=Herbinix hemicellulosilytica TaxID=1564487 RepID=A0A0H5SZG8_HERHM|nr:M15 family metallopeptidase [Herbinix hemicellulosilytica]RBP58124.1 D-alanyl-D-alanine carboxypeptidase-like protein [Herbinix hemicellulosilytica]CRZ35788.1 hypothetical protein HHT355_2607 [Herbinix hemicellulosilytica]HPU62716.1 M15 family metallopeptidase [Mobilitalea sp.]
MGRRILILLWILPLCFFMGSCKKNDTNDNLITINSDMYIDENDKYNGVMEMTEDNMKNIDNGNNDEVIAAGKTNVLKDIEDTLNTEDTINNIKKLSAGTVINVTEFGSEIIDSLFYFQELDRSIIDRIYGKSYKENCDVPYSDLRYVRVLHTDFEGQTRIGELIVNKAIAQDIVDIFKELYSISYPIEKMLLVDEYDANDLKSMADNNTSAFNFRFVEGTTRRSNHSDGLAIDINPLYNPYVRTKDNKLEILPENGAEYADRDKDNIYYIKKDDPCYKAFINRGFTWGGEWKNSKDYQHFEKINN